MYKLKIFFPRPMLEDLKALSHIFLNLISIAIQESDSLKNFNPKSFLTSPFSKQAETTLNQPLPSFKNKKIKSILKFQKGSIMVADTMITISMTSEFKSEDINHN